MHVCVHVCVGVGVGVFVHASLFFLAPPPHFLPLYLVCLCMHAYMHVCVHSLASPSL